MGNAAYPAAGRDGQDVINAQIGDDYEIFLGIMWKRLGTPTGRAPSGTVEEYERALSRYKTVGTPQLMFYFKTTDSAVEDDLTQLTAVRQFRSRVARDGLLYWEFLSPEQLGQLARIHLTRHIQNWARHQGPEPSPEARISLAHQFNIRVQNMKTHTGTVQDIIARFARHHTAFLEANSQRASQIRSMPDEQLNPLFQMKTLAEMTVGMREYAEETERLEADFSLAFSSYVQNVLGAAAICTVFPNAKIQPLRKGLAAVRANLRTAHAAMGNYVTQLRKSAPYFPGLLATFHERSVSALGRFCEHVEFSERLLLEAERLFDVEPNKL